MNKILSNTLVINQTRIIHNIDCIIFTHIPKVNSISTVCCYHVMYTFQSESTLYILPECQGTRCSKQAQYLKFK